MAADFGVSQPLPIKMKRFFLTFAIVASSSTTMFAGEDSPTQQILTTAQKQADLFGGQGGQFHTGFTPIAS